jgi:hypothetical protein
MKPILHPPMLQSRRGSAAVELALGAPLILLVIFGVSEYSRAFQVTMTLEQEAISAALLQARTEQLPPTADQLTSHSATLEQFCSCPDKPASGPQDPNAVACEPDACGQYGAPRRYIRSVVRRPFASVMDYLGVPIELTGGAVFVRAE